VSFVNRSLFGSIEQINQIITASDILVIQRDFPSPENYRVLRLLLKSGKPVVYELDDMIWELPPDHHQKKKFLQKKAFILECLKVCDAVTVSTPLLAEYLSEYNSNVVVLPNLISRDTWLNPDMQVHDRVVIGFAGTRTHVQDLKIVEEVLIEISNKYKGLVEFKFYGCITDKLLKLEHVQFLKFDANYASYARNLLTSGIDIAIAPLQDTVFNCCKSNIKWLEYSSIKAAGVYSDLPPYNSDIINGKTGMLVGTRREWYDALCYLIENEGERNEMARLAAEYVSLNYSMDVASHKFLTFYTALYEKYKLCTLPDKELKIAAFLRAKILVRQKLTRLFQGFTSLKK